MLPWVGGISNKERTSRYSEFLADELVLLCLFGIKRKGDPKHLEGKGHLGSNTVSDVKDLCPYFATRVSCSLLEGSSLLME